ncbi:KilA-N domain-containing protein [Ignavigranum ruoffiae]|uniref:KilA-N domain-containing protein n=1 Tax=Ignavigranum ruoffiae TaxID=89093 RepID=UPI003AFFCA0A
MVKIVANGNEISILKSDSDYISLTDIAKYQDEENPRYIIQNWMRNKNTIEFLGTWENLNNENFNRVEFEAVKNEVGKVIILFLIVLRMMNCLIKKFD